MNLTTKFVVPADHPSLPGHFPGAPVVPGVLILDEVQEAIQRCSPQARIVGIRFVKFLSPLLPDESVDLEVTGEAPKLKFRCAVGARVVATGVVLNEPDAA